MQQQKEQEWTRQKPTTSRRRNSRRGNDVKASVEREEEDWESEWETEENTHWRKTTRTRFKLCYSFLNCDNSQILSKQADDESKLKIWQNTGNKQKKTNLNRTAERSRARWFQSSLFFFLIFTVKLKAKMRFETASEKMTFCSFSNEIITFYKVRAKGWSFFWKGQTVFLSRPRVFTKYSHNQYYS